MASKKKTAKKAAPKKAAKKAAPKKKAVTVKKKTPGKKKKEPVAIVQAWENDGSIECAPDESGN